MNNNKSKDWDKYTDSEEYLYIQAQLLSYGYTDLQTYSIIKSLFTSGYTLSQ